MSGWNAFPGSSMNAFVAGMNARAGSKLAARSGFFLMDYTGKIKWLWRADGITSITWNTRPVATLDLQGCAYILYDPIGGGNTHVLRITLNGDVIDNDLTGSWSGMELQGSVDGAFYGPAGASGYASGFIGSDGQQYPVSGLGIFYDDLGGAHGNQYVNVDLLPDIRYYCHEVHGTGIVERYSYVITGPLSGNGPVVSRTTSFTCPASDYIISLPSPIATGRYRVFSKHTGAVVVDLDLGSGVGLTGMLSNTQAFGFNKLFDYQTGALLADPYVSSLSYEFDGLTYSVTNIYVDDFGNLWGWARRPFPDSRSHFLPITTTGLRYDPAPNGFVRTDGTQWNTIRFGLPDGGAIFAPQIGTGPQPDARFGMWDGSGNWREFDLPASIEAAALDHRVGHILCFFYGPGPVEFPEQI